MSPLLILSFIGCAPQDAEVSAHFWTWLASNSSAAIGEDNLTGIDEKATIFECSGRGWDVVEGRYEDGYIGPRSAAEANDPRFIGGACELDEDGEPVDWCTEEIQQKWADQCNGTASTVGVLETFMYDDGYYAIQGDMDPWRTEALINGENDLQLTVHHYLEKGQDFRFTFSIAPDFEPTRCISTENGAEIQKVDGASWVEKWSEDEGDYYIYYLNAGTAQPTGSDAPTGDILYLTTDWLTGYGFSKFAGEEFNSVANTFAAAIPDNIRASCESNMDNVPPFADAGADLVLNVGETVTLTGALSEDMNDDTLSYVWIPDGDVSNEPSEGMEYEFLAEVPGTYTFTLAVSDGAATTEDEVVVVVPDDNTTPVCEMGLDVQGDIGAAVAITGVATDADGDTLGYHWEVLSAPVDDNGTPDDESDDTDATFSIGDETSDSTTFTGDMAGQYVLSFTACEGGDCDANDDVVCTRTLNVNLDDPGSPADNSPPLCQVNIDQVAVSGDLITLDGTGTIDPDGDELVYEWSVTERPSSAASREITGADQLTDAIYDPSAAGIHGITLTATEADDGDDATEELSCSQHFNLDVRNLPPLCPSSRPVYVEDLGDVVLDFSGATDPNDDELTFEWDWPLSDAEPRCGDADLSSTDGPTTTITRDQPGQHTVKVTVSDGISECESTIVVLSTCNDEYSTELSCLQEDYADTRKAWTETIGAYDPADPSNAFEAKFEDNQWRPVDQTPLGLDGWAEVHTSWVRVKKNSKIEKGGFVEGDYQIQYQGSVSSSAMLVRGTFKVENLREDIWAYGILEDEKRADDDDTPGQQYCQ
jgi:hypothetical protein